MQKIKKKLSNNQNHAFIKHISNKRRILIILPISIVLVFFGWLFISALLTDAKLSLNPTYSVPKFASLDSISLYNYEGYGGTAIAIDGAVVKKSTTDEVISPTASTAKMLLGLAVMQAKPFFPGEPGETIAITEEMYNIYNWYVNHGGSNSAVAIGEEISEYDALMSVFLVSSNNMADSLAIWAFGSLDNYKNYVLSMLDEWGISNITIGPDASGFDAGTTATASDLAIIGSKVLENPVLKEIVGTSEYAVPVAGKLSNTNLILGRNRVIGVKTGYIGSLSNYCLVSGYLEGEHIVTVALMGAPTRLASFNDSLNVVASVESTIKETTLVSAGDIVGYYDSWWTGPVEITADEDLIGIGWDTASISTNLEMSGETGILKISIDNSEYKVAVSAKPYNAAPTFGERLSHSFGWSKEGVADKSTDSPVDDSESEESADNKATSVAPESIEDPDPPTAVSVNVTNVPSENCTIKYGYLMLINPNFTVTTNFIDARRSELVSVSSLYGIQEGNSYNGDNLLDAEAAAHLNEMVKAYESDYPGHTFKTYSCYRARGTQCGRLCAATGASDHHTGLTCDLVDPAYGTSLDTDQYNQHIDWQWLYTNSYKYGFIDRFPAEWAGGSMDEPLNVDENGSTGLFETWHYRYVGVGPATEIATGKYNGGKYDSLEHYLKSRGLVTNLKTGACE